MAAKLDVEIVVTKKGDLILKGINKDVQNLQKNLKNVSAAGKMVTSGFKAVAAVWAAMQVKKMIEDWSNLNAEMEAADQILSHIAVSSGKYSKESSDSVLNIAKKVQEATGIHRQFVQEGMKMLVGYGAISEEVMERATKAMVDYTFFTGSSMTTAAQAIGRASQGAFGELANYGLEIEKEIYLTKGFVGVLEELENQMGGVSQVYRATAAGTFSAWDSAIKDLKNELGEIINLWVVQTGVLDKMIDIVVALTEKIKAMHDLIKEWMQGMGLLSSDEESTGGSSRVYRKITPTMVPVTFWELLAKDIGSFLEGVTSALRKTFQEDEKFAGKLIEAFKTPWVEFLTEGRADWNKFLDTISKAFATRFIDKMFDEIIRNRLLTKTSYGQIPVSGIAGAGAVGYSAYQGGDPVSGAITGALTGGYYGGPMGAGMGAFAGGLLGVLGSLNEKRATASVTTFWDVVDGEVKLLGDQWKNSPKSKELLDRMQAFLQTQVDFFTQANLLTQGRGLGSMTSPDISVIAGAPGALEGASYDYIWIHFKENADQYAKIFGEKISIAIDEWLTGKRTGGFPAYWDALVEEFQSYSDFISKSLGNAFVQSLETGEFDTFKDVFKQGLYEETIAGLTNAFLQRNLIEKAFGRLNVSSLFDLFGAYGRGDITASQTVEGVKKAFEALPQVIEEMKPIWEEFNKGLIDLRTSMDINTDTLYSNIKELKNYIDTVEASIADLKVSDLAPALTYKVFQGEYERLLGGAGTQEGLQDFIKYIQGEYLPFMRDYATNYADVFEKVIDDLEGLETSKREEITDALLKIYEALGGVPGGVTNLLDSLNMTISDLQNYTEDWLVGPDGVKVAVKDIIDALGAEAELGKKIEALDLKEVHFDKASLEDIKLHIKEGIIDGLKQNYEDFIAMQGPEEISEGVGSLPGVVTPEAIFKPDLKIPNFSYTVWR